jgi:hypothetical protein
MTPQDCFIAVAVVPQDNIPALRDFLAREMTWGGETGMANPANAILPFGHFDTIHFGRLVVLEDHSIEDRARYGIVDRQPLPAYLALMIDCDGDAKSLLKQIVQACPRLGEAFQFCADFSASIDLEKWLLSHRIRAAASYVNWVGRTVIQVREEAHLREMLRDALPHVAARDPQDMLAELRRMVSPQVRLSPPEPTPVSWRIANAFNLLAPIVIAAALLILVPWQTIAVLIVVMLAVLIVLRRRELTDPILPNPYSAEWVSELRKGEDHDVTNQYTAMGSIRPGGFRLGLELVILAGINWAARHVFTMGGLARIGTIHFAHWVLIDGKKRAFFCSNYDGSHEAYMDDFISKAGFGLNLSFSSAIAYPQTDFLVAKGAWREMDFKHFQRRHQLPTDVWYKAYPGLTAHDLARNSRIRNGFEKPAMGDDEIRRWLAEI